MNKFKSIYKLNNIPKGKEGGKRLKNKEKKQPLLTIITVVLNQEKYLEETIKSVINQKFKNFEYIIIDGDSKDNSLKIIKKYSRQIDYWVSQKDKGLYFAFNKGMKLARGKYVGIINSDDVFTKSLSKENIFFLYFFRSNLIKNLSTADLES